MKNIIVIGQPAASEPIIKEVKDVVVVNDAFSPPPIPFIAPVWIDSLEKDGKQKHRERRKAERDAKKKGGCK